MIRGYNKGDDITLINTIYYKPTKMKDGKYSTGSLDIIYVDNKTKEKKLQHIDNPEYTYYMANEGVGVGYNRLYIEKDKVHPVTCKYNEIKKDIASRTNNLDWFYDNIRNGNYRENDRLFSIPHVFNADMDIEDWYRYQFDQLYTNTPVKPTKLYFDIEVDGINQRGAFPELGECPVNAMTLISEDTNTVYTLLLNNPNNKLIDEFKQMGDYNNRVKSFVRDSVGGWKNEIRFGLDKFEYKVAYFDEEIELIHTAFSIINHLKPDFALAWNIAFDLPYLIERIKVLGYTPESIICHPDFPVKECYYYIDKRADKFEERNDYAHISCYTVYLDQLISFASIRKGQRSIGSYKLDDIGYLVARIRKLDYSHITTQIAKLPYLNYMIFVLYNIMDTMVQKCIEHKVGDIDFIYNKSILSNTRYSKIHRQTVYLINIITQEFFNMGLIIGCNVNKRNEKVGFAGAFVANPQLISDTNKVRVNGAPVNLFRNLNDFDYKSLYPSEIAENNMAPDTQLGKVLFPNPIDPKENKFNNDYFDRSVWFIEDYVSHNRLDFCNRYLNLATYEEMYDDVIYYFTNVQNPQRSVFTDDSINGRRYMCHPVVKTEENNYRQMVYNVDNSKPRNMILHQERMPELPWKLAS